MKLWEVMRLLEENPKREFEAKLKGSGNLVVMSVDNSIGKFYMFDVYKDGSIIGALRNGGTFNGNVSLELEWCEVKQPVPWQEAIQAWGEGRKIRIKNRHGGESFCSGGVGALINVTHDELVHGTWYVED